MNYLHLKLKQLKIKINNRLLLYNQQDLLQHHPPIPGNTVLKAQIVQVRKTVTHILLLEKVSDRIWWDFEASLRGVVFDDTYEFVLHFVRHVDV